MEHQIRKINNHLDMAIAALERALPFNREDNAQDYFELLEMIGRIDNIIHLLTPEELLSRQRH